MVLYEYGTSPRKQVIKNKSKRTKPHLVKTKKIQTKDKKNINLIFALVLVFTMLFIIIYRNSMLNEAFSQMQGLKKELTALQKETDQLEVNIQNSINLNNIETSAKQLLGMQKLTTAQTVYINLDKKDYVEANIEAVVIEEDMNWIKTIKNKILEMF